ncbi:hypothetical protein N007_13645 [Alicyclobacillus acidoterrestris ATCC 49025]|nr:hypothetical protein N007_13645 [Alicyclobacillus acidoterrestris ATCC 49025]
MKSIVIAKNMLAEGMEVELIVRLTGLSVEEINNLRRDKSN